MTNIRKLIFAAGLAAIAGSTLAVSTASAFSGTESACRQQGYRRHIKGVWYHYVTVFYTQGGWSKEVNCGPAF
jgi:hypothetical protein